MRQAYRRAGVAAVQLVAQGLGVFVYVLWRVMSFIGQRLPLRLAYLIASLLGDCAYYVWREGRLSAKANMARVLRAQDARAVSRAARQSFRNYLKYLVDFMRFPRLSSQEVRERVLYDEWHHLDRALEQGKGIILVTAHFGNWDLGAAAVAARGYKLNVIAESFSYPPLNQEIQGARAKLGMNIIPLERAGVSMIRALRRNELLALLIDRPAPGNGVTVTFFGEPVSVPAGPARLALRTGAKVIPVVLARARGFSDRVLGILDPTIDFEPSGDEARDIASLTGRIMASLERMMARYPEQWYMFRRLWTEPSPGMRPETVLVSET
ncbi:MAG TPA: lysophospholipid acyltransferase family protein [Dehalococcoidia bacterium]